MLVSLDRVLKAITTKVTKVHEGRSKASAWNLPGEEPACLPDAGHSRFLTAALRRFGMTSRLRMRIVSVASIQFLQHGLLTKL
jgi:hypothetical protein